MLHLLISTSKVHNFCNFIHSTSQSIVLCTYLSLYLQTKFIFKKIIYTCIIQFEYRTFNFCSIKWTTLHQNWSTLGHALTQLEYVFQPIGITMT